MNVAFDGRKLIQHVPVPVQPCIDGPAVDPALCIHRPICEVGHDIAADLFGGLGRVLRTLCNAADVLCRFLAAGLRVDKLPAGGRRPDRFAALIGIADVRTHTFFETGGKGFAIKLTEPFGGSGGSFARLLNTRHSLLAARRVCSLNAKAALCHIVNVTIHRVADFQQGFHNVALILRPRFFDGR